MTTRVTRSGRISKKPTRLEPTERPVDDFSDGEHDSDFDENDTDICETEDEDFSSDEDEDEDADDNGNLAGFVVDDEEESDEESEA
jgi:hypothetical protein|tara:strand:+ start:2364 stop:2621 length:258 start_codon:yes stop_codon:yes gene_type:complete